MRRAPVLWMPWASGPRPVAMVVHTMAGTRSGSAGERPLAPAGQERAQVRHLAPREHLLGHAPLEAVDAHDADAQAGGHDREVGAPRPRRGRSSEAAATPPAKSTAAATSTGRSCWRDAAASGRRRAQAARREHGHRGQGGEAAEGQAQAHPERRGPRPGPGGARPAGGCATRSAR